MVSNRAKYHPRWAILHIAADNRNYKKRQAAYKNRGNVTQDSGSVDGDGLDLEQTCRIVNARYDHGQGRLAMAQDLLADG